MLDWRTNPYAFDRLREKTDALRVTKGDLAGPILVEMGALHRKQMNDIFRTEGAAGAGGKFVPLNPSYAARKKKLGGRKKILQLTKDMVARFTKPKNPNYFQRYVDRGESGVFEFGARSDVAAAHFHGNPALAAPGSRSAVAKKLFGGVAKNLPRRDMITKTQEQVTQFRLLFIAWYHKRVAQVMRHQGRR